MNSVIKSDGWKAQLDLGFEQRQGRTVLARKKHVGPLVVQKPFYPEGPVCHVYIIHPPGGVVGGDGLTITSTNPPLTHSLITTPAANKFYRTAGPLATLEQHLSVMENAVLEWLPQETIVFDDSAVHTTTKINLNNNSRFIGWEITCLGRPASGETFSKGVFRQNYELWQQDKPLLIERALLQGGHSILTASWGLQSFTVSATMFAYPANKTLLEVARAQLTYADNKQISATLIDNVLVCRYLGHHAEQAKADFTAIWTGVRPRLLGREACVPRIWRT